MGLAIFYTARLAKKTDIPAFLTAARREAKARAWKVVRSKPDSKSITLHPHAKCEDLVFDFTKSLTCEHFVKTSFAPLKTHVQVVEFLRAMEPLLKKLTVDDECEYWQTGDRKLLKQHRDGFDKALGTKPPEPGDKPISFTLGAVVITSLDDLPAELDKT